MTLTNITLFEDLFEIDGMEVERVWRLSPTEYEVHYVSFVDGEPREPITATRWYRIEELVVRPDV